MISPKCHRCGDELNEEGAILLSPPSQAPLGKTDHTQTVWTKRHICTKCYRNLEEWLMTPQGGVDVMIGVCQDLLKLDGYISMHESFAKDWEPVVEKARKAITYKGGGTIRP